MDILERIIEGLTSDEVRRFKILSNRFKADEEKKLLQLFDAVRAGNFKAQEDEVVEQLYGDNSSRSRNSYYRLRNKLMNNLEKSLLFYHFNYKNSLEAYANVQLAILYRERGLYREAHYSLRKAEKTAREFDQFSLLEVIYDEIIGLAGHCEMDVEAVIERRHENLNRIELIRNNREVLAMVNQQLMKRNFSRNTRSEAVIEVLESAKSKLEAHQEIFRSVSGRVMIMRAVVSILLQKAAYADLEAYVRETFEDFEEKGLFNKDNHHVRLLMRIWRINSLLKLLRLKEAGMELDLLRKDLMRFHRQNFSEYGFYYFISNAYFHRLSDDLRAAHKTLEEAFSHRELLQNETNAAFLLISLADQYFCQQTYAEARQTLSRLSELDEFNQMGEEIRLYVAIFDMLLALELGQHDEVARIRRSLKKKFRNLLKDESYQRAAEFLDYLQRIDKALVTGKSPGYKKLAQKFGESFGESEIGDNQIILYEVYLRAKAEDRSYQEVLIETVQSRQ